MPSQSAGACRTATAAASGSRSPRRAPTSSGELHDAANAVLALHELEAAVDVVEREAVRDEGIDVDLAREVAVDELRDLLAALDPAERRAHHAPAGDQVARHDVEGFALARDARHAAGAPSHPGGLDGLAHDADETGRLKGEVGAEAAGLLQHAVDDGVACRPCVRRAVAPRQLEALVGEVDCDDPLRALEPAARHGAEADHPAPEDDARAAGLD